MRARLCSWIIGLAAALPAAAMAEQAFTTTAVNLRAGPDADYPLVPGCRRARPRGLRLPCRLSLVRRRGLRRPRLDVGKLPGLSLSELGRAGRHLWRRDRPAAGRLHLRFLLARSLPRPSLVRQSPALGAPAPAGILRTPLPFATPALRRALLLAAAATSAAAAAIPVLPALGPSNRSTGRPRCSRTPAAVPAGHPPVGARLSPAPGGAAAVCPSPRAPRAAAGDTAPFGRAPAPGTSAAAPAIRSW